MKRRVAVTLIILQAKVVNEAIKKPKDQCYNTGPSKVAPLNLQPRSGTL